MGVVFGALVFSVGFATQAWLFDNLDRFTLSFVRCSSGRINEVVQSNLLKSFFLMESLILAQSERWRRGLGMQVERIIWPEVLEAARWMGWMTE